MIIEELAKRHPIPHQGARRLTEAQGSQVDKASRACRGLARKLVRPMKAENLRAMECRLSKGLSCDEAGDLWSAIHDELRSRGEKTQVELDAPPEPKLTFKGKLTLRDRVRLKAVGGEPAEDGTVIRLGKTTIVVEVDANHRHGKDDDGVREMGLEHVEKRLAGKG